MVDDALTLKLIEKYNKPGPRYTSYPTANHFSSEVGPKDYLSQLAESNDDFIPKPLSLYVHIPFCDTLCYYCACTKVHTKNREKISHYLAHLEQEIKLISQSIDSDREVQQLHFGGGTPHILSVDEMSELMQTIASSFRLSQGDERDFSYEVDPRTMTYEKLCTLKKLGFNRLSIGVQDFDLSVQKNINRIQSLHETEAVCNQARELGFESINIDIVYGLPGQTVDSLSHTINNLLDIAPDRIAMFNYAHLPKAFPYQRKIDSNTIPKAPLKFEFLLLAIGAFIDAGYKQVGIDHFIKPTDNLYQAKESGELQRNFQGYSTHAFCDQIGLGTSAIGRVNNSYFQNTKEIDEYCYYVSQDKLPIKNGLLLNSDDILRRDIINQLMCAQTVYFPHIEHKHGMSFKSYFLDIYSELVELKNDGLVRLDRTSLAITPLGRLFARQVCSVFDAYMTDKTQHKYSNML